MSYNVRDDAAIFGPNASVELLNGAGAPTISKLQVIEPIIFNAPTASQFVSQATTAGTFYTVFIAPPLPSASTGLPPLGGKFQVAGMSVYYTTAAGAAARLYAEIVNSGVADGSGTNIIGASTGTGYYSLATALPTVSSNPVAVNLPLSTNVDNLQLTDNGHINLYATTQATTSLVDLCVAIYLIRY